MKQVSFMKDNTYHLHRHMWNDVSEDWQFYSEQVRYYDRSINLPYHTQNDLLSECISLAEENAP